MSGFLDEPLALLASSLDARKEDLRDCNGEMSELSDRFAEFMDAWYSERSSDAALTDSKSLHAEGTAYIIPCPDLHPIPYNILKKLIEDSDGKIGLEVSIPIQFEFRRFASLSQLASSGEGSLPYLASY